MDGPEKTPWPRSWPPFWRAALHIAIATAAGNVTFAAGVTVLCLIPVRGVIILSPLVSWATVVLAVAVSAALARTDRPTRSAVLGGFVFGWVFFGLAATVSVLVGYLVLEAKRIAFLPVVGLVTAFFVLRGCQVTAGYFTAYVPQADPTRVRASSIVGGESAVRGHGVGMRGACGGKCVDSHNHADVSARCARVVSESPHALHLGVRPGLPRLRPHGANAHQRRRRG